MKKKLLHATLAAALLLTPLAPRAEAALTVYDPAAVEPVGELREEVGPLRVSLRCDSDGRVDDDSLHLRDGLTKHLGCLRDRHWALVIGRVAHSFSCG